MVNSAQRHQFLVSAALGDFAVVAIVGALAILLLQVGLMATQAAIPASLAGAMLLEQACMVLALLWWDRWRPLPAPTARTSWVAP